MHNQLDERYVAIDMVKPSPYQNRRGFNEISLLELGNSIKRIGLIEPIIIRPINEHYELIAGERRWRASKLVGLEEILSRIIIVDDFQAREMALAENLQREDLSAIEETWGITKLIDIQLHNTCEEYKKICQENYIGCNTKGEFLWNDQSCRERVKFVLMKADSDRKHNTDYLGNSIVAQIEDAFQSIYKDITWQSFYNHRLPDIINIDQEVQDVAIEKKLNSSQTKALDRLKKANKDEFKKVVREGIEVRETDAEGKSVLELKPIKDVSGVELTRKAEELEWGNKIMGKELFKKEITRDIQYDIKCGDTLEILDTLPTDYYDLIFVDPPYGITDEEWDIFSSDNEFWNFTENWLDKVIPRLRSTGRLYICFSQEKMFGLYELMQKYKDYIRFGNMLIWNYRNNIKPHNPKIYKKTYEPIFYYYKDNAGKLNMEKGEEWGEDYNNLDCWTIAQPQSNFDDKKVHPAQKPIELLRNIIRTGSKPGDKILDPFAGSGTTGVVCKELGRDFTLIEKEPKYIEIIRRRLSE